MLIVGALNEEYYRNITVIQNALAILDLHLEPWLDVVVPMPVAFSKYDAYRLRRRGPSMLILYRVTRADDNVSFMALYFYEQSKQRHFNRHVARLDRVRKDETQEAGEGRFLNEAQICGCK